MLSKKIIIRLVLLGIVTIVFLGTFLYYFFTNSQASSPRNDKEYMEQLASLSKRYNAAGDPVITPSPTPIPEKKQNVVEAFSISILDFLTNLIK